MFKQRDAKKDSIWLTCKGHCNADPNVLTVLIKPGGTKRRSRRNLETPELNLIFYNIN
jgi:hypothetical protein